MKKIFTFATLLSLITFNANALILDPYVGLDYNYNKMNFGHKTEDLYADNYQKLKERRQLFFDNMNDEKWLSQFN